MLQSLQLYLFGPKNSGPFIKGETYDIKNCDLFSHVCCAKLLRT